MTTEIHGHCDAPFAPLREAFAANFDEGLDIGASLGVTHRGKMVVDLWGGYADRKRTRPWEENTIVQVFSTSKIMTILMILMLIDRGAIELDAPVARYWPDFARGGKAAVTIRDALTHQSGVPGFATRVPFEALHDWDSICARVAAEPHWFEGRRVMSYHFTTFGFVLGEVIRRVDGRMPSQFFREEIAAKCIADCQMCLTDRAEVARVAGLNFDLGPPIGSDPVAARAAASIGQGDFQTWERMSAEIPASNGFANGRSIARLCAILAMCGELDGVRYVGRDLVDEAATEQVRVDDGRFGELSMGLGFGLYSEGFYAPSRTSFHWGGVGGSWGLMDAKAQISLGFAPNNLLGSHMGDPRLAKLSAALERVLPGL